MSPLQMGADMSALEAGFITSGYGVAIVLVIRVGVKLLQRFGPRQPMLWRTYIVNLSILLLLPTNLMTDTYKILAALAFTLFGIGLAFYATPSTDAALSSLPDHQAGSGSGIYKMASSLGASFGVAFSATIFTAMSTSGENAKWIDGLISFTGRQDDIATREAAPVAFGFNLLMVALAVASIMITIPHRKPVEEE